MNCYSQVLIDRIDREKAGLDYTCSDHDRNVLNDMFKEINTTLNTNFHYIAELDSFDIIGAGSIMLKYIHQFDTESVRAYLTPQLVSDKVIGVERLVIDLYRKFKFSPVYISPADKPSPAHIYARYDTAISKLKPQKYKNDLVELVNTPRDVFYLPMTAQMIASWKLPQFKDLLLYCSREGGITFEDVELPNDNKSYYPSVEAMERQLKFIAIISLKYYPTRDVLDFILRFADTTDLDLSACAKKSIEYISKHLV